MSEIIETQKAVLVMIEEVEGHLDLLVREHIHVSHEEHHKFVHVEPVNLVFVVVLQGRQAESFTEEE